MGDSELKFAFRVSKNDKSNSLASGRRFFSKLSALMTFRPNSSANSDEMECIPTSGAVRRYADVTLTSRASDDFCRNISDGFILRSNELDGLSESFNCVFVIGTVGTVGTVGGSTGAALRIYFGGGLKQSLHFSFDQKFVMFSGFLKLTSQTNDSGV